MQKLINVLAVASFVTSAAIVAAGITAYNNRAQIFEYAEERAMELVKESIPLPGVGGTDAIVPDLPFGF